jgi:hypothetical protein
MIGFKFITGKLYTSHGSERLSDQTEMSESQFISFRTQNKKHKKRNEYINSHCLNPELGNVNLLSFAVCCISRPQ